MIYLSPLPTDQDLRNLYQEANQFDAPEYVSEDRVAAILEYITQRFNVLVAQYEICSRPLRVLEVGAGWAWMCRAAKSAEFETLTVAQDISAECAQKCPWVDRYIVGNSSSDQLAALGPFDIISVTHVLEHVPDPSEFLRRLGRMLDDNGVIFVTMPHRPREWDGTYNSWLKYSYHHIPAHLQYFSEKSLRETTAKAGLSLAFWDASHEQGEALEAHLRFAKLQAASGTSEVAEEATDLVQPSVLTAADDYRNRFEDAKPFKHLVIEGFFDTTFAESPPCRFSCFRQRKSQE